MCVYSMTMDHFREKWEPLVPKKPDIFNLPLQPIVSTPQVPPEEVAEFKKLLERAREYDKKHNQADCDNEEKKAALKKIADALGINISFIDDK